MNALELAYRLQFGQQHIEAAALLRRQYSDLAIAHEAIVKLREALTELSGMYVVHHNAATRAKQALKDTEEFQ